MKHHNKAGKTSPKNFKSGKSSPRAAAADRPKTGAKAGARPGGSSGFKEGYKGGKSAAGAKSGFKGPKSSFASDRGPRAEGEFGARRSPARGAKSFGERKFGKPEGGFGASGDGYKKDFKSKSGPRRAASEWSDERGARRGGDETRRAPRDGFQGNAKGGFKEDARDNFRGGKPKSAFGDARPARSGEFGERRARPAKSFDKPFEARGEKRGEFRDGPRSGPKAGGFKEGGRDNFRGSKPGFKNEFRDAPRGKTGGETRGEQRSEFKPRRPRDEHAPAEVKPRTKSPRLFVAEGRDLLYGWHAVLAALGNPQRHVRAMWVTAEAEATLAESTETPPTIALTRLSKDEMDAALPGAVHQGIALECDTLEPMPWDDFLAQQAEKDFTTILLLDQVTDPHNIGAILRSAAAFGAAALVTTERNTPQATAVLGRAAAGALEVVPWYRVVNLARALDDLREAGIWCVGLDERGQMLDELDVTGRIALVLGAEGSGLRRLTTERCDALARLPTAEHFPTLNVSNAAAVALYALKARHR